MWSIDFEELCVRVKYKVIRLSITIYFKNEDHFKGFSNGAEERNWWARAKLARKFSTFKDYDYNIIFRRR